MSEPLTAAEVQRLAEVIGLPVEAEVLASVAEQLTALLAAASGRRGFSRRRRRPDADGRGRHRGDDPRTPRRLHAAVVVRGPAGDLGARRRRGAVAAGVPLVAAPFMEARLFRIAARLEADGVAAAPVASARS